MELLTTNYKSIWKAYAEFFWSGFRNRSISSVKVLQMGVFEKRRIFQAVPEGAIQADVSKADQSKA